MAAKLGALDDFLCFEDDEACEATDDNVRDHDDALIGVGRPEAAVLARAHEVGYANRFRAVRCDRPWRALPAGARGARLVGAPSAVGVHTAIVTNAEGATEASGEDEIYRNARGDVRVRFHWQADGDGRRGHGHELRATHRAGSAAAVSGRGHRPAARRGRALQRARRRRHPVDPRRQVRRGHEH
ncbi:hypothetical protein G6F64_014238 [Rhizopus arrhizus]|uniref:Uncharacterized protein n=1 Tax=Rhizopus oryzae TaxID=64495 RepID=A0A9P7BK00_RHIOR|nr:hypothetical protein G6F64_014238 [Rhizopus arrhizus]